MACHNPISCRPDGVNHILVPCGSCEDCINRKRADWTVRLLIEEKIAESAYFVTLTYTDDNLPFYDDKEKIIVRGYSSVDCQPVLLKSDLQKMFKRYRKTVANGNKFKYYAIGEYGEKTFRPHYHIIAFNVNIEKFVNAWQVESNKLGRVHVGKVTKQSINYVTSYVINKYKYSKRKKFPPFAIMSKGLGKSFVSDEMKKYFKNSFSTCITVEDGAKYALPRYFKQRLYRCETAIRLHGIKARKQAEINLHKDLKEYQVTGFNKIVEKRKYQRDIFKKSTKSKL